MTLPGETLIASSEQMWVADPCPACFLKAHVLPCVSISIKTEPHSTGLGLPSEPLEACILDSVG